MAEQWAEKLLHTYLLDKSSEEADDSYLGTISGSAILRNTMDVRKVKNFLEREMPAFSQLLKIKLKFHGIYFLFIYWITDRVLWSGPYPDTVWYYQTTLVL